MKTQHADINSGTVEYALVIHGGAGTILKENMTDELDSMYRNKMQASLEAGQTILASGGSAGDAVIASIRIMEDSPLFNAGKGAVFTHQGNNELDASIMDGKTLNAGAVGGITKIKNPIEAARAVMDHSEHVLLVGKGADDFAISQGLETVDSGYFHTKKRYDSLKKIIEKEKQYGTTITALADSKYGTVGAVALDKSGNIVAGTSTGGMTNKKYNRVGDSPIIGAGTYAKNTTCGVSCTGHGEYFIRYAVAHDVSARMEYGNMSLEEAAGTIVHEVLKSAGGSGGLIALDAEGNITMPFNTPGMYRGYITDKESFIAIYGDEQ